jgi:prepilin-type processing-associated H-X9-DG protein
LAILMPSLQRARGLAKRVVCQSNLRQLGVAAQIYANSYNGSYPLAQETIKRGSDYFVNCWDFMDPKLGIAKPGLLWQGQGYAKIQQCPAFRGPANWTGDPYTGYNYNASYIGGSAARFDNSASSATGVSNRSRSFAVSRPPTPEANREIIVPSSRVTQLKHPATTAIFGDGQWSGGANKYMRAPFDANNAFDKGFYGRAAGTQGFRHLGQTNVSYGDGSVRPSGRRYTRTEAGEVRNIAAGTGFLSPDNSAYDLD